MILAPINGPEFSRACRRNCTSPASCRLPQLLRLLGLTALAASFVFIALDTGKASTDTPAISTPVATR
jgi:hypothetical protein